MTSDVACPILPPAKLTTWEVEGMTISDETLNAMVRDYHGFDVSDDELKIMRPELESYLAEADKLRELDLSDVFSARLLQAREDG